MRLNKSGNTDYKWKALYNHYRICWDDKLQYLQLFYLPYPIFRFTFNEWKWEVRFFSIGFNWTELPF